MKNPDNTKSELVRAIERLGVHDHLCLIYSSREEQLAAVIPFIRMGLERGEKCIYIADDNTVETVMDAMRADGIGVDSAIDSGALSVIVKREAYLREGYFNPDLMIQFLKDTADSAKESGFKALRVTGEMTWALGRELGRERLIEYEAKLNYFFPGNDVVVICQYNRKRFKPEIIMEVIRTHPLVIHGSTVCKNFYYVPPDEFLKPKEQQISMEVERLLKNIRDYEHTEEKLREASVYTRSLIEVSLDPLVTISPEGKITDVNEATESVTGVSREKLIGSDFSDYFTEPEKAREGYMEVFDKGFVKDYPLAIRHVSGSITDVLYNASVYKDATGNVAGVFAAARDITDRKRAEEKLRESDEKFRNMVESVPVGIVITTPEGKIIEVNSIIPKIFGYSKEDLKKLLASELYYDTQDREKFVKELLKKGRVADFEAKFKRKNGSIFWGSITSTAQKTAYGKTQFLNAFMDITERKRTEGILSARYRLMEFAVSHSVDELLQKTLDEIEALTGSQIGFYHFLEADQKTLSLHAWSTRTLREKCTAEGRGTHYDVSEAGVWVDCIHQRRPVIHNDYASLPHRKGLPPGHAHVIRELVVPVIRGEKIMAILGIGNKSLDYDANDVELVSLFADLVWDIAERKKAENLITELNKELEQRILEVTAANKELEGFTYSASHDLRAPLRHINSFAELLLRELSGSLTEMGQHHLNVISDSARQMGVLMDEFLDYIRIGRKEMLQTKVNLDTLVIKAMNINETEAKGRDIVWNIHPLPEVYGDAGMLRLIFINLISNAVKFTRKKEQAHIEIGHTDDEKEFIFFIRDNGAGFDMQYVNKLFNIFQRLHRFEEFEGTGVGLANVRRIINRHGGRVWAEGAIDGGATFYFTLPKVTKDEG